MAKIPLANLTRPHKTKAPWVIVGGANGEIGYCERCGDGLRLNMPQPIPIFVAASQAFVKMHSRCKPGKYIPKPAQTPEEWAAGRDTGISSLTIYHVMTGNPIRDYWYSTPSDPSDFGRCYRLLKLFPQWKPRLQEVAVRFPEWKNLVSEWDALEKMYERELATPDPTYPMYRRMKELGL